MVGFSICLFLLYNLMPLAMKLSSATVVNLSLLTADFYSLLCGLFLFHYEVSDWKINRIIMSELCDQHSDATNV